MKASVQELRWGLAGAGVLLLVVVGGFLGYGSLRKVQKWKDEVKRLGLHGPHETENFTYSNSLQGHTSYTVHAAKVIQHGDGKWSLRDVAVTLYSKTSTDVDHIYSSNIEYDEHTGVANAMGEVHMDLQAPGGLSVAKTDSAESEGDRVIHVRTSGLVYVRRLAVAATEQMVEFKYAGMECTSKGAEFDSGESFLHLLADVQMHGTVKGKPVTVKAVKADLDRQTNTVEMVAPVAESQGQTVRAANALLHLRRDGSLMQADAGGGVRMDAGTQHVTGATFTGTFGATSLPEHSKLMGGVEVVDSSAVRPLHATAREVESAFDGAGSPKSMVATGGARMTLPERALGQPDLAREMRGERIQASFVPVEGKARGKKSASRVSEVLATGGAMVRGESVAKAKDGGGLKTAQMWADNLRAVFDAQAVGGSELKKVFGTGKTKLEQDGPRGAVQTSTGDVLEVAFAKGEGGGKRKMEIASATQTGHVLIHDVPAQSMGTAKVEPVSDASADKAVYDGAASKLTLVGGANFSQAGTVLRAATIAMDQVTGNAEAQGAVLATLEGKQAASKADAPMTHVSADRARLTRSTQVAEFWGTEAHPARLWQDASQVQAATLVFDQKRKTLTARPAAGGVVHAVFAGTGKDDGKKPGDSRVVRVSSAAMDYDDVNREATFGGGVRFEGATGQGRSQRGVVFLNSVETGGVAKTTPPVGIGGSVRRIVLSGDVLVQEPGRTGTGDQLVYTAADSSFILTGTATKPPHMVDAQQGSITGTTLLFHQGTSKGDSTIVVSGAPATPGQTAKSRVRTETDVKK